MAFFIKIYGKVEESRESQKISSLKIYYGESMDNFLLIIVLVKCYPHTCYFYPYPYTCKMHVNKKDTNE